jgi:SAM-dependent methyltransferase
VIDMPHPLSARLLTVFGPCRVLHVGGGDAHLLGDLLLAGCDAYGVRIGGEAPANDDGMTAAHPRCLPLSAIATMAGTFDALVIEARPGAELLIALPQLLHYTGAAQQLALIAPVQNRRRLEDGLFAQGWRRHPRGLTVDDYPRLSDAQLGEISFYQRVPAVAAARWPVASLQQDRALHMDMLRESGSRADAHVVRYALAAQLIRPGDTVVDCACGLGYGSAVLAALSRGARFLGLDLDAAVIDYATANYAHERLRFAIGDAAALQAIPDASIDMVVSMETIEHVPDWEAVLAEFRRILKPDGRLIASVPDRWVDASGRDPNPYHLHAFDWRKFAAGLSRHFIIEARYQQAAPGGFKLQQSPRILQRVELESSIDSEWLLAVASVDPLAAGRETRDAYRHPAFQPAYEASNAAVVAFAEAYDNPSLYRPLVQMGERLMDDNALVQLATRVVLSSDRRSADRGAAIAVLGYRVLEARSVAGASAILENILDYLEDTEERQEQPHLARWRLSLSYLAGRLSALRGERVEALAWFETTANLDYRVFSPILATKVVAAAFQAGLLYLTDNQLATAETCFTRGLSLALSAARAPAAAIIGNLQTPIPFALQEMAEVLDMGGQCATALTYLPLWPDNPGQFWQQIDIKRFGLASWARDLLQVNDHLLGELQKQRAINQQLGAELDLMRQATGANQRRSLPVAAGLLQAGQATLLG